MFFWLVTNNTAAIIAYSFTELSFGTPISTSAIVHSKGLLSNLTPSTTSRFNSMQVKSGRISSSVVQLNNWEYNLKYGCNITQTQQYHRFNVVFIPTLKAKQILSNKLENMDRPVLRVPATLPVGPPWSKPDQIGVFVRREVPTSSPRT